MAKGFIRKLNIAVTILSILIILITLLFAVYIAIIKTENPLNRFGFFYENIAGRIEADVTACGRLKSTFNHSFREEDSATAPKSWDIYEPLTFNDNSYGQIVFKFAFYNKGWTPYTVSFPEGLPALPANLKRTVNVKIGETFEIAENKEFEEITQNTLGTIPKANGPVESVMLCEIIYELIDPHAGVNYTSQNFTIKMELAE